VAYIEPHIEQGPALLAAGFPVGIVTGICGSFRHRDILVRGEYAHSGATSRALRHDAVHAGARLVVAMRELWQRLEAEGEDLTVTFGQFATDPANHSFSKVAGEARLCLDVRSQSRATLERVRRELAGLAERIAAEERVTIDLGPLSGTEPAKMSSGLNDMLLEACSAEGVPTMLLPSGAGHDAATFAAAGIPATMLFIRNENGSHNPDEHMDFADFDRALAVLHRMIGMPPERWLAARRPGAPA
jgi:N-carbamoyl-L-amino-acid hydrolase